MRPIARWLLLLRPEWWPTWLLTQTWLTPTPKEWAKLFLTGTAPRHWAELHTLIRDRQ